jgi:hypothetical protein
MAGDKKAEGSEKNSRKRFQNFVFLANERNSFALAE